MLEKHLLSPVRNMFVTLCGKSLFAGRSLTLPLTQTIYAALMASSAVSGCAPKVYLDELVCDQELALCPLMITQPLTHKFARRHACGMDDPPFCRCRCACRFSCVGISLHHRLRSSHPANYTAAPQIQLPTCESRKNGFSSWFPLIVLQIAINRSVEVQFETILLVLYHSPTRVKLLNVIATVRR